VALSAVPDVVTGYTTYAGLLGNVFSPITGVLLADYVFLKSMKIDLPALFQRDDIYWYWRGFNPVAIVWTALGFLIYMYVIPTAMIKTLCTVAICGLGYTVTAWVVATYWPALRRAARPRAAIASVEELAWQLAER
jgi:cytosine/uracil/thiamine/allantoin permease